MKKNLFIIIFMHFLFITKVMAQCNLNFFDGFESGSYSPTWSVGSGVTSGGVTNINPAAGTYSLYCIGGTSSHLNGFSTVINPATPSSISWYMYTSPGSASVNYFVAGNSSVTATNCVFFTFWSGSTNQIRFVAPTIYNYSATPGQWYFIQLKNINWTMKTFDIFINGVQVQTSFPFRSNLQNNISHLHLYNFEYGTGYWDNITIGEYAILYGTTNPVACDSYTSPLNNIYTTSGTYTETLTSVGGCDSILTINLTINHSSTTTIYGTTCDSMIFNGNILTTSGIYYDTLTNALGCDSIIKLHLTVHYSPFIGNDTSVFVCWQWENVDLNSFLHPSWPTGGIWYDNDLTGQLSGSIFHPNNVVPENTYDFTYFYDDVFCPAEVTVSVYVQNCTGIDWYNNKADFLIYPNPSAGKFNISSAQNLKIKKIAVTDVTGKTVTEIITNCTECNLDLSHLNNGIYFLKVFTTLGTEQVYKIVIDNQ